MVNERSPAKGKGPDKEARIFTEEEEEVHHGNNLPPEQRQDKSDAEDLHRSASEASYARPPRRKKSKAQSRGRKRFSTSASQLTLTGTTLKPLTLGSAAGQFMMDGGAGSWNNPISTTDDKIYKLGAAVAVNEQATKR